MEQINLSHKYDFVYFAGDSFTFAMHQGDDIDGVINEKNRFSGIISDYLGLPEINVGLPGCSNMYIFRKVYEDIYKFITEGKKFLAVISYTNPDRMDMFDKNYNYAQPIHEGLDFYKSYILNHFDSDYCNEVTRDYILAIHTLFDRFNIDYVEGWAFETSLEIPFCNKKRVLDRTFSDIIKQDGRFNSNGHANIIGNSRIADQYIKKIMELYGTD